MLKKFREYNVGLWPALLRACCLLLGIMILGAGAKGIGSVKVEKAQVFFSIAGFCHTPCITLIFSRTSR
jgi:hypothetical protein